MLDELEIEGDVYVSFFAAVRDFKQDKEGKVDVFLRDRDSTGDYTEIARATVSDADWQHGTSVFLEHTAVMPMVQYTVPEGNELELRVIVRDPAADHMWFAFDTNTFRAALILTGEFREGGTPYYLHNDPSPPAGSSDGIAVNLTSANGDAYGVASYSSGFLVLDRSDRKVYKYSSTGDAAGDFDLDSGNGDARGITTDGSTVWVVDRSDDQVYTYDIAGTSTGSFHLTGSNDDPRGITTDGTTIWVVDRADDLVYAYDMNGVATGANIGLDGSNDDAEGVATDGTFVWITDEDDRRVYKYHTSGTGLGSFNLRNENANASGITSNGSKIWVVDRSDDLIYEHEMDGSIPPKGDTPSPGLAVDLISDNRDPTGIARSSTGFIIVDEKDDEVYSYDIWGSNTDSFDLDSANSDGRGITTDGSSVWVLDRSDDKVYQYNTSGTLQDDFDLDSANDDARGITTDGVSIWVVDDDDRKAYKYSLAGAGQGNFDLDSGNGQARGIATDGSSIWVVDRQDDLAYIYSLSGTNLGSFPLTSKNHDPEGIATDGSTIWVVDAKGSSDGGSSDDGGGGTVYVYDMNGLFQTWLPMDRDVPPSADLFNYDTDRDNDLGLTIKRSKDGLQEDDRDKFQTWRSAILTGDLVIEEDSYIDFFAAMEDFEDDEDGEVHMFLRDRDPATGTYVEIGRGTIYEPEWHDVVTGEFVPKTIVIVDADYTVPVGHEIEIKVVVDDKAGEDMWFAFDTATYPAVLYPSVLKMASSAVGANFEFLADSAVSGDFPVTFTEEDFQPYDFDFVGDIDLFEEDSVWVNTADKTQLKPGVYHTTGTLTLDVEGVSELGGVTFVARDIVLKNTGSKLTPSKLGVLMFATGVGPSGAGVRITNSDHMLTGIIYAPAGKVEVDASRVFIDGSVFSQGFEWSGSNGRIAFNPDLFEE